MVTTEDITEDITEAIMAATEDTVVTESAVPWPTLDTVIMEATEDIMEATEDITVATVDTTVMESVML